MKWMHVVLVVGLLFSLKGKAQDPHFSLVNTSPLNLNPALAGMFGFDHINQHVRYAGNFRQQWRSVSSDFLEVATPFNSVSMSIDGMIKRTKAISRHFAGVGLLLSQDRAGDLGFGQQQLGFMGSYHQAIGEGYHFFSGGFGYHVVINSFDLSKGFFDNQWTGLAFDPSLPTGEFFPTTRISFSDFQAGVALHNFSKTGVSYNIGAAVFHVTQPEVSFYGTPDALMLPRRVVGHGLFKFDVAPMQSILPSFYYHAQGPKREYYTSVFYKVDKAYDIPGSKQKDYLGLQAGIGFRVVGDLDDPAAGDAVVFGAKFRKNRLVMAAAYDVNVSRLRVGTNARGAVELSVLYHMDLYKGYGKPRERKQKAKCPPGQQKDFDRSPDEWKY